jgi:glycosyltransferase involved in cell wall biosynthesis
MTSSVGPLVLVNGPEDSVPGPRARALVGTGARIVYKKGGRFGALPEIQRALSEQHSGWIYCIDLGFPASPLAALRRRFGRGVRLAYELGDPSKPLFAGRRRAEIALAHEFDRWLPGQADALVFRGSYLKDYFEALAPRQLPRSTWLPDGADTRVFRPMRDDPRVVELRRAHGLEGRFVVGVVGSLHHARHLNIYYGWDLAEALSHLPREVPVTGVVVGDGDGRKPLEAAKARFGLGERLKLVGRVPHEQVPLWMNVFDVGLSTQTDDPVGWGRTTAKLPEYLACGLVVACTDVGEAHRLLRESGQTLPYRGQRDDAYPERLARHLERLAASELGPLREANRRLAVSTFDYGVLGRRLREFLADTPS